MSQVAVQILDQEYALEDLTFDDLLQVEVDYEIGGVADPLGQLVTWLWGQVSAALSSVRQAIENFLISVRDYIYNGLKSFIESVFNTISGLLDSISSALGNVFESLNKLGSFIESAFNQVGLALSNLGSTLLGVLNAIYTSIGNAISQLSQIASQIAEVFGNIINTLSSVATQVYSYIESLGKSIVDSVFNALKGLYDWLQSVSATIATSFTQLYNYLATALPAISEAVVDSFTTFKNWIWTYLQKAFSTIGMALSQIGEGIVNLGKFIWESLQDVANFLYTSIANAFSQFADAFMDLWRKVQDFFTEQYNRLVRHAVDISMTLQGFVNPLQNIANWLAKIPETIGEWASGIWRWIQQNVSPVLEWAWNMLTSTVQGFIGWLGDAVKAVGSAIVNFVMGVPKFLYEAIAGAATGLVGFIKEAGKSIYAPVMEILKSVIEQIGKGAEEWFKELYDRVLGGRSRGELVEFSGLVASIIGFQFLARYVYLGLMALGEALKEVRISPEVKLEIAGAGPGVTIPIAISPGAVLKHIASEIKEYPDVIGRAMIYGTAIWLSQPYAKLLNYTLRNMLPITLPTLDMVTDVTRRTIPTREFKQFVNEIGRTLALYGYQDGVIKWYTTTFDKWYVEIEDRFGRKRKLPISLLYRLPSPSDFARMMVHDIFGPPEKPLPSFKKAMAMVGMNEDIAKLYYMLHFKYPPLEKLYEFACRTAVGLSWVDIAPVKEEDLGAENFKKPIDLNAKCTTAEAVKQHLTSFIDKYLKYYAKWHDYATWSWIDGFTSDGLILMDLMADIPQRIDARWMYKWSIIDDKEVFRIVTARGLHPDWVERITIAECMNALQEERTLARTGVISSFKEGFLDIEGVDSTLKQLATVKILDKDVPVKFLPGEVELLKLRAKYDRALDILRDYSRDLVRQSAENIISFSDVVGNLKELTGSVAKELGINLGLDEGYFKLYEPVAGTLREIYTTHRIRIWIRYMMYRILTRFSEGYMKREEIKKLIEELVAKAKLTDEEKSLLVDVSETMFEFFSRQLKARTVLWQLKRGKITAQDAKNKLVSIGLDEDTAINLIENELAKLREEYTLSISTLLSYATIVAVPESLIKERIKSLGIPEEDANIILQVFKIRPIRDELSYYTRKVLDSFEDGYITEEDLKKKLQQLFKRPEEITLLLEAAKYERQIKKYRLTIDAIINRLRRGAITVNEARDQLKKVIKDEALIDLMIEKYAKLYTISPSTYVSWMERIPVDINKLRAKLEAYGVPPDDIKYYIANAIASEMEEELRAYMREVARDYEEGYLTDDQFKAELDNIATLWGQAKSKLGVDWIVFSPQERALLYEVYRRRRERRARRGR